MDNLPIKNSFKNLFYRRRDSKKKIIRVLLMCPLTRGREEDRNGEENQTIETNNR